MKGLHALIMAGGSGTRFWPISREMWPKQMLNIVGEETMITQTIKRVNGLVARKNIHIVTTESQAADIRFHIEKEEKLPASILTEPCAKNTAPAIGLAAIHLKKVDPESTMLVMPADHFIRREQAFLKTIRRAVRGAEDGCLVTIGIKPTRPDTGYGYIKIGGSIGKGLCSVERFVEKPDLKRAERYLADGNYYWNSGIFIWKTEAILREMRSNLPSLYRGLKKIEAALGSKRENKVIEEVYPSFKSMSIDYGVMEKSKNVCMVPGEFEWSDVGSWSALDGLLEMDSKGNIIKSSGNAVDIGSKNCTIFTDNRIVATIGLRDMVVVDTPDATLVCPKNRCQDVKKVVGELKKRGREEHILHRTVERPWGSYTVLEKGNGYKIKRIFVRPGSKLSLQLHRKRSEHWVVVSGTARVTRGEEVYDVRTNESTYIPISVKHRLENPGPEPLQVIEVQNGSYVEEDDIVRFDDMYGR
jgi:mannose-1-phosphate guanylyltransferase/mannose-6-phosphate isomerase